MSLSALEICAGNSQRKNAAMFDRDDADSVSSSSTMRSDLMSDGGTEEVEKDSLLDQAIDALYEKRYIQVFNLILENQFCFFHLSQLTLLSFNWIG